jgi:DHA2 family multidrug resistance protein
MIDTNKPSRQPQMMAIWGMGIMAGPILGPILGGWLTENWNWRAVFYVNVPLGFLSLAILFAALPSRQVVRRRFDLLGFAVVAITLTSVQLLLDRGNHIDWFDALEAWVYAFLALSGLWIGVIHFTTAREPLFNRQLFADPNFIFGLLFSLVVGLVMFANMALLPPMLQRLFGYDVIETGIAMVPRGVGTLISMQISGILVRRGFDPRVLLALGFAIAALSMWQMSGWNLQTDFSHIATSGFIQGLGIGLVFIPINASSFATLPPLLRTDGSSLLNLSRSIGSSLGISIVITMLGVGIQTSHADLAAHVTASASQLFDISSLDRFQGGGEAALLIVDREINRQAAMISYVNDFYMMMWMSLAVIPLAALMRRANIPAAPPSRKDPAGDLPH